MKSMWSSHIPNIDFLPIIVGSDVDPNAPGSTVGGDPAGGAGTGAEGGQGAPDPAKKDEDKNHEGDPQKKILAQDEIIARKQEKLDEAETELQELRKFREETETAKLTEQQKRDKEFEEVTQERDTLRAGVEKLVLKNAFLSSKEFDWHNPERALALVDLSDLEVVQTKDGSFGIKNPDELSKRIKALAESDGYLLKKEDTEPKWTGKTGDPKPGNKKVTDEAAERARLEKKYPSLRK